MLTIEECIALCGLTQEEVHAIATHERIPEVAAAELGAYLVQSPGGELCVKAIIKDDIAMAEVVGNRNRVLALKLLLRNFVLRHPRCDERHRRELHIPERRTIPSGA